MTLNAIFGGFECCQGGLGAKIHKPGAPKLGPMFSQVVVTLFETLLSNKDKMITHLEFPQSKQNILKCKRVS